MSAMNYFTKVPLTDRMLERCSGAREISAYYKAQDINGKTNFINKRHKCQSRIYSHQTEEVRLRQCSADLPPVPCEAYRGERHRGHHRLGHHRQVQGRQPVGQAADPLLLEQARQADVNRQESQAPSLLPVAQGNVEILLMKALFTHQIKNNVRK